ncbi:bacteriohemerythrin [Paramagnetospirillum magneticum]|nr:bacteriohemerythrin [Paramagnetospirillum magneticum]
MSLSNLRISMRLSILTGVLCIALVTTIFLGRSGMLSILNSLHTVYEDRTVCLVQLGTMQRNLFRIRVRLLKMLDLNAYDATMVAQIADAEEIINKEWKAYLTTELAAEEKVIADKIKTALPDYLSEKNKVIELLKANDPDKATSLANGPALQKFMHLDEQIVANIELQERIAKEEYEEGKASASQKINFSLTLGGLALALGAAIAFVIARSITGPVNGIKGCMEQLTAGNLSAEVPGVDRGDELGQMAKAVGVFKEGLLRVKEMEAEQEAQKARAEAERKAAMRQLANTFEGSVGKVIQTVTSAATQLQVSSTQMASTAAETSAQATTVASASQQASANVETVAAATEELSSSITEIAKQVERSQSVASRAQDEAANTNVQIRALSENANKIGEIVNLINDIASQTNLLALNATIEAARAGDAGKGFAVVANEVKHLATQTGKATEEIASQIRAVQDGTNNAVHAIDGITKVISEMGEISASVASAVEEQAAATQEIARNVEQAAAGTAEVSSSVVTVEQAARDTGAAAEQIHSAATDLSQQSEFLRAEVGRFLDQVRSDQSDVKLLNWDNALNMGIGNIDRHHREMFDEVNRLYAKMSQGNGAEAGQGMITLIDTVMGSHFREEEEVMSRNSYPHLDEHRRHHRDFLDRAKSHKGAVQSGDPTAAAKMFEYVATWLTNHIQMEDGKLANYLKAKKVA